MSGTSATTGAVEANNEHGGSGSGSGERGSSSSNAAGGGGRQHPQTLDHVMRAPSTTLPDVVVLNSPPEETERKEVLDPKEDLWLSTADGRFSSPIIPLRVGESPDIGTFYVHKHILLKSKYFERALCGEFRESNAQSIDLPEEDPGIFHFLIAFLYEGKYDPIKPIASVLVSDHEKGKGKDAGAETGADSDSEESGGSSVSDISAVSRRRRERRHRREDRRWEQMRQKHPGLHRPNCGCPQCLSSSGLQCWHCQAPRAPPPPGGPMPQPGIVFIERDPYMRDRPRPRPRRRHGPLPPPMTPPPPPPPPPGGRGAGGNTSAADPASHNSSNGGAVISGGLGRITGEDLRTWLLAYELNIDVYILANKFLLDDFKREIARVAIDMLETAGSDAAVPKVLYLCRKLYEGLSERDPLLKMIFARVAFLQPWRSAPEETQDFLMANPEIAPLLLSEMMARREDEFNGRALPSMERAGGWLPGLGGVYDPLSSPYRGGGGGVVGGGGQGMMHGMMGPHHRGGARW
ncbi:hypothetical protein B0T17DRAFT_325208 [Bombardia bombarda]|uniref:BTB domain-containing protein n=1 Tax=Bombardia bombarda TaxID=252184 RepID=A0AA39WMH7_9PEZI|nr:hypothetical protein B0T17DRAFT_325208 [Bombardia bombarda]